MTQDNTLYQNDTPNEKTAYLPIPDFYKKNGYDFKLIKRQGDVAIFSQYSEGEIIAYEVFEIRKQKEADWGEIHYEAKERIPSNEEWGNNAYTVWTLKEAMAKVAEIQLAIDNRNIKTS